MNRKQSSSFCPDASKVPRNPQLDSGFLQRSCWKLQQGNVCDSSGSCGKLQQSIGIQLEKTMLDDQTLQVTDYGYVEKVFKNLRHKLSRSENDEIFDLTTNVLIWGLFMSTTMKSAVHPCREYQQNLIACRNTNFEDLKTLFDVTLRLIVEHSLEIQNLSSPWMRATLCHDQVIKWAKAKVHVHSDSVLCLGKLHSHSEANEKRKDQISAFQQDKEYAELSGINGEPIEFEWNISQDSHRLRFSDKSRKI